MNHAELLFAATVLDLASKLKARKKADHYNQLTGDKESKEAAMKEWLNANPTSSFAPEALAKIRDVAALIKTLE